MIFIRIILTISGLIWGALAFSGFEIYNNIAIQNIPGSPSVSQTLYYIVLPSVMSLISLLSILMASPRRPAFLFALFSLLSILMVLPYMLFYTGGV